MGVNCKGLCHTFWTIFVDYFQEAGGAGRDGLQSESHLIILPKRLNWSIIQIQLKIIKKITWFADEDFYCQILVQKYRFLIKTFVLWHKSN